MPEIIMATNVAKYIESDSLPGVREKGIKPLIDSTIDAGNNEYSL